jgi:hypothetical protein
MTEDKNQRKVSTAAVNDAAAFEVTPSGRRRPYAVGARFLAILHFPVVSMLRRLVGGKSPQSPK